jgi:hypothetical protein
MGEGTGGRMRPGAPAYPSLGETAGDRYLILEAYRGGATGPLCDALPRRLFKSVRASPRTFASFEVASLAPLSSLAQLLVVQAMIG